MILGTGIDIISVARVGAMVDSGGGAFLERWFSPEEIAYCSAKAKPRLHFAARLAAKEATAKALRLEWEAAPAWRDISVRSQGSGAPFLVLAGAALEAARVLGVEALHISLSHADEYATASVILEGPGPSRAPGRLEAD
jgi:holo-[acyl-carrier protein] synthase